MKNRWILNLALGVAVVALGLLAVFKPGGKPEAVSVPLTPLAVADIGLIRITRTDQAEILLEEGADDQADEWRMVEPRSARVNRFRIDEVLRLATATSESRFPADPQDLAQYGLDKPRVKLWLDNEEIHFGNENPVNGQRYVWYAGQVHLIAPNYFRAVNVDAEEFLSTRLIDEQVKLVSIRLPKLRVSQDEKGNWQVAPANAELSTDRIHAYVNDWQRAQALRVAPYSGRPAQERIQLGYTLPKAEGEAGSDADSPPAKPVVHHLELGVLSHQPDFVVYRKDEGLEYHFAQEVGTRLMTLKPDDAGTP